MRGGGELPGLWGYLGKFLYGVHKEGPGYAPWKSSNLMVINDTSTPSTMMLRRAGQSTER